MYRVAQRARKLGYKVMRSFEGEAADQTALLASNASVANMAELAELVGEFDEAYMRKQIQQERTADTWSVSVPFVIELHLIKALARDLQADDLVKLGWAPLIAKRVITVAKAEQEEAS
jgi:hypothetical protein